MPEQHSYTGVWMVLGLIVVAGFAAFLYFYSKIEAPQTAVDTPYYETMPLIVATRDGDYQRTLLELQSISADASKTPTDKAFAAYNALGAEYRLTGELEARLEDVRKMKAIVMDGTVAASTRIATLNTLANQYAISGREPAVFEEIYKDEPFSKYLVPGDPDLSARKLYEWSYSIRATSYAAINIARWYTEQYVLDQTLPKATVAEYAQIGEDYLKKADDVSLQEIKTIPEYTNSTRYLLFRYWRAVIVGRLAVQVGEPYLSQYRTEYDSFIEFALTQKNVLAKEYLLYARLFYAQRLINDNNQKLAVTQIDQLAEELDAVTNLNTNVFVRFLINEQMYRPNGINWVLVKNMAALSPDFKAAVERVIAPENI